MLLRVSCTAPTSPASLPSLGRCSVQQETTLRAVSSAACRMQVLSSWECPHAEWRKTKPETSAAVTKRAPCGASWRQATQEQRTCLMKGRQDVRIMGTDYQLLVSLQVATVRTNHTCTERQQAEPRCLPEGPVRGWRHENTASCLHSRSFNQLARIFLICRQTRPPQGSQSHTCTPRYNS